jgi:hypothetical protein
MIERLGRNQARPALREFSASHYRAVTVGALPPALKPPVSGKTFRFSYEACLLEHRLTLCCPEYLG